MLTGERALITGGIVGIVIGCLLVLVTWFILELTGCSAPTPPPDEGMPWPTGQGAA